MRRGEWTLALALCVAAQASAALEYPRAPRGDTVDEYFGTQVPDPYRWLEDVDSAETAAWVAAQDALSRSYLQALPDREAIRRRLEELWNYERYGVPYRTGDGTLVYTRNDGLQDQAVLYVQPPNAEPRVLVDPNPWAADGTGALAAWAVSPDGSHLAYARQAAGSDWVEYRVRQIATGRDLPDRLTGIHFNFDASRIEWRGGRNGFFYARFPHGGGSDALRNSRIYYHRIGTPQQEDVLIYEQPDQPAWFAWPEVTDDGRYLLIYRERSEDSEKELFVKDLGDRDAPRLDAPLRKLISGFDARYALVGNRGPVLVLRTTRDAPRGRLVTLDLREAVPALRPLVAQSGDVLVAALHAGDELLIEYLHDAASRLTRHAMSGRPLGAIALPGTGTLAEVSGRPGQAEIFYGYTSFNRPLTIFRHDLATGAAAPFRAPKLGFSPEDYVTEQVFYESTAGARVPLFISHRKGLRRDGRTPTLLHGYGGFGIALTPSFQVPNLVWMERGGVYAQACLRGGSEYGEEWHRAGSLERKQNVFDDFIAAGEHLIRNGYTSPAHLAVSGASNGGLLVGAVTNQRPDLMAVATQSVGVLDMLRYHKFGVGYAWAGDYGTAENEAHFETLYAYSPYHRIRPGTAYPAVLVLTADHDDRVWPAHSFKYVAALQAAQAADRPVLIRIETRAGHGGGTPLAKIMEAAADQLAFLARFTASAPAPEPAGEAGGGAH
jgi:prolyl oligopeptidase